MSEKLQKVLAAAGLGSRREMERWISEGRVAVNGRRAELGARVEPADKLTVDGRPVTVKPLRETRRRVLIYNKPEGEISSRRDPEGRPTVFERLPRLGDGRWIAVGRLDFNTSGLLLFTNDGELANALMHPKTEIEREYLCRVMGEVNDEVLARLREGVLLEDGMARFAGIAAVGGKGINRFYRVMLREGRNREVRRLWESQGLMISRLKRVRFGNVEIPSVLKVGDWLELNKRDVDELCRLAGVEPIRERRLTEKERVTRKRHEARLRQRGSKPRR